MGTPNEISRYAFVTISATICVRRKNILVGTREKVQLRTRRQGSRHVTLFILRGPLRTVFYNAFSL